MKLTLSALVFLLLAISASADEQKVAPFYQESRAPHQLRFLHTGLASLQARLDLIESARERIELESFIIHADFSTRLLLQALIKKAKQGVQVRLLFDHFFSGAQIDPFLARELERHGIEVRFYNPASLLEVRTIHYRNHRKLLSVDDQVALIGGRNLRDRYFDLHQEFNYVDRDVIVEGPLVLTMRESFDRYFDRLYSKPHAQPEKPSRHDLRYKRGPRHEAKRRFQADLKRYENQTTKAREFLTAHPKDHDFLARLEASTREDLNALPGGTCSDLTWASDYPGIGAWAKARRYRLSSEVVFDWMSSAKTSIMKESAFIIINQQTEDMLEGLLARGVELKMMTNSFFSTDLLFTTAVFFDRAGSWLNRGMRLAVYSGEHHPAHPLMPEFASESRWGIHSKSAVVDEESLMMGSLNFDPRSFTWSSELILLCREPELARELARSMQKRWDHSLELKGASDVVQYRFDRVGLVNRLGYYLVKYPASLLDYHL